jgi:hypothetical protein
MKGKNLSLFALCAFGFMIINSFTFAQGSQKSGGAGNSDLNQLLEKARKNQVELAFTCDTFNDDNTFSVVERYGKYSLVLPLKDCFLDIKCGPTCDQTVLTGHGGDHLWTYLLKHDVPYKLDGEDLNETMISVIEGLISKGIPVTYKATPVAQ